MRLKLAYTLHFLSKPPPGLRIPLRVEIHEKVFGIDGFDETRLHASAYVEGSVDIDTLIVQVEDGFSDRAEPARAIEVPERRELGHFLNVMVDVVTFLIDVPIRTAHRHGGDQLIPESRADKLKLESIGTSRVLQPISGSLRLRSLSLSTMDDDALETLYEREVGVALYRQALLLQEPIGLFREFWKILESAFGAKDRQLIHLLSEYRPATELGFTGDELREFWILRGRASHAESGSGNTEVQFVNRQVSELLPRLKCLVEQVIVTKRTWGSPALGVERIAELASYVRSDGTLVIIRSASGSPPDDGNNANLE